MKVGVLGGGQLGQMLAAAGQPLGIEVDCYDESATAPAAATGAVTVGRLSEPEKLRGWAQTVDVITYEFENFPSSVVQPLAEYADILPSVRALAAAQDRWHEKRLFEQLHLPVSPFRLARSPQDLALAVSELDPPVVVKTRTGGYDGKGQVVVRGRQDLSEALALVEHSEVVVEQFVNFDSECSIIGVRSTRGEVKTYPLSRNQHRAGILHASTPWAYPETVQLSALAMMSDLMDHLDYVGVLALELFETDGTLVVNEMAPRVHNSGHWTIEGAKTSQFENHLRAVTGLPLGNTEPVCESTMVNLIGTTPPLEALLSVDGAHVHLYGKSPRPYRKLGHVTVTGRSGDEVAIQVKALEALLS